MLAENGRAVAVCFDLDDTLMDHESAVSEEAGSAKPAPDIFRQACRELGARPGHCLHVGDRWDIDVAGARGAGLRAAWLNRSGRPRAEIAPDVTELASLATLTQLVASRT